MRHGMAKTLTHILFPLTLILFQMKTTPRLIMKLVKKMLGAKKCPKALPRMEKVSSLHQTNYFLGQTVDEKKDAANAIKPGQTDSEMKGPEEEKQISDEKLVFTPK